MRLRLSEAILLGSALHPKAIGIRHAPDGSSCALGAAEDACGIINPYSLKGPLEERFPELLGFQKHPIDGLMEPLAPIIASLNNGYSFRKGDRRRFPAWSRETIASWVATVEPQPEPEPTPEPIEEPVAV
jgi:hypothetical protein